MLDRGSTLSAGLVGALLATLAPVPLVAAAAAIPEAGHSEVVLLAQLAVLLAAGRLFGDLMQRLGQPAVMGQLLAGVMLGPSLLGLLSPAAEQALFPDSAEQRAMLDAIAQLGILLVLLLTGMETDLKLVRKVGRSSLVVAACGLSVPFACGYVLGELLPESLLPRPELRLVTSLFLGTALSVSSVKIVATVIREMEFLRRNIGQVIIAAAIIEDAIGWIIIALILGIAVHGKVDAIALGRSVVGTAIFLALSFTLGRRLVARLIRWTNDHMVVEVPVITAILVVMAFMSLTTHFLGVHTVLGAFVAGMLVGQSPILTRHVDEQLRGLITALFMPVVFAVAGLRANLNVLADPKLLAMTGGLVAVASIGKFAGAFAGGRVARLSGRESFAMGCAMNARGSTEVIVATIGLSMGALGEDLYTMIVGMAVITTLAMPPMLRRALARVPIGKEEQARLDREARDATGFVSAFERLLLAADSSMNGRFAAHLAGLIAGPRQILATVLKVEGSCGEAEPAPVEKLVESAAQKAREALPEHEQPEATIEVTTRSAPKTDRPAATEVEREARKGYDMLMVGLTPTFLDDGLTAPAISDAAQAFNGPLAIVDARGLHRKYATPSRFSILLPIRATSYSRHGAELAIELARASRSEIEALFVSEERGRRWTPRASFGGGLEDVALKDVVALAESHGIVVRTSVQRGRDPAAAILDVARRSRHDLIVLGVSRRLGDQLFFGETAAAVVAAVPCSVLLVAS